MSLDKIQIPIASEMAAFEIKFKGSMKSNVALLDTVTRYIVKRKGKQMRPMFVFLAAKVCGEIQDSSYTAASLIELLHTATLVHDDVVDEANYRRGFFSINALWKNKIAVLVGDFLLSRGLLLAIEKKEHALLEIVSKAVKEMSEGELLQIEKARRLDIKEEVYFQIIRQKTASLIASCCACGASSVKAKEETVEKMWAFGEKIGIAFQIKDDLFDFGFGDKIGKPTGIDIKEKKMTLPLIYALNHSTFMEKRRIINTIKNHNEDKERVTELIDYVINSGGIEYAAQKMEKYKSEALVLLDDFIDSEAKTSLIELVEYSINRKK